MGRATRTSGYIIVENDRGAREAGATLPFAEAIERATALAKAGAHVRVLYPSGASQTELSRFANHAIPTTLIADP